MNKRKVGNPPFKGRTTLRDTDADVAKHRDREDLWLIIDGKVFSVTKYLEDHPGGEEVLIDKAGEDATEDFEDVGHSNEARKTLAGLEIGVLPPSERGASKSAGGSGGGGGSSSMLMALPVLVVVLGVAFYFLTQE